MYSHQLTTLPNGLRLITIPMPQVESATVMVGIGAGSRYETKRLNGLFHFLEHMAFKGTKKRPSTLDISTEVDSIGGLFNAFTSKEATAYFIKAAAKHTPLVFDILSDMLTSSLFKPEEIEREKGVIIEELNLYEDTPTRKVWEVFERLLYGDTPMGRGIGGQKENIRQMKREDFIKYINRLYYPVNVVVGVAGKLNQKQVRQLADEYFGLLKKPALSLSKGPQTPQIPQKRPRPRTKLVYKKTEQAHFCLGVPSYWYSHPDRFALALLATVLGGGMSSRLFIEVRERRGLAYYVQASPEFFTDSGYLLTGAGVRLKKIEEAIKVVLEQCWQLTAKKVPSKELKKAKEFLKGGLVLALEDSQQVVSRCIGQALLEKKIQTPEETMKLISKVTSEDIQRVAKDIFRSERLNLALIGPYRNQERFERLLR